LNQNEAEVQSRAQKQAGAFPGREAPASLRTCEKMIGRYRYRFFKKLCSISIKPIAIAIAIATPIKNGSPFFHFSWKRGARFPQNL